MKEYRVSYYEWLFNRYGDRDFIYMEHWCSESTLKDLQNDSHVDELEVHEEREV